MINKIQSFLNKENISLKELQSIENLLTKEIAEKALSTDIYDQVDAALKRIQTRDWQKRNELKEIDEKIDLFLFHFMNRAPQDNKKEVAQLQKTFTKWVDKEEGASYFLKQEMEKVAKKLLHATFLIRFPIACELFEPSYQPNFIQRMKAIEETFQENPQKGTLLFMQLPKKQREEIEKLSPQDRGEGIRLYTASLQEALEQAEKLCYESSEKAEKILSLLQFIENHILC